MKKLILVTMLAVAASWLLSEPRRAEIDRPQEASEAPLATRLVQVDGETAKSLVRPDPTPEPPGSIHVIPWRPIQPHPEPTASRTNPTGQPGPSWFPKTEAEERAKAKVSADGSKVLIGRLSASPDRARLDLREVVGREVASWLSADVPPSWKVPSGVLDEMVQGKFVQQLTKDLAPAPSKDEAAPKSDEPPLDGLYTLYRAGQKLDFSPTRRADIIGMYRRDLAASRMKWLGGSLALTLVGLAVLSGYIKADEATKGYYTNRLRLAAAGGLGAAGVAAYRFLV